MKKSRFSDSQILSIIKQAEVGTPVPELYREHGISSATFYKPKSSQTAQKPRYKPLSGAVSSSAASSTPMAGEATTAWSMWAMESTCVSITLRMSSHEGPHQRHRGLLGFAKSRLTRFRGMNKQTFYHHLKECEFRFNHRREDIYPILLRLCRQKPLN